MSLAEFRQIVELLPDGACLTLSKGLLLELTAATGSGDLTVRDLAERLHRAPSTIRGWLEEGRLPGAYKLNGRDWRVPLAGVESFLLDQRTRYHPPAEDPPAGCIAVGLGAWRQALRPAA